MATVTGDAVFDAIAGFNAGGSGLALVNNGTTDTATTVVNAAGSITIGNSFRFITERFDINTGRGTGNADNLAIQQDNSSQTIITLDTGTTQQDDVILGDLSLSGQLVRAATGTAPYIFGSAGTPTGDITTGDAADGNNYEWSMVNPEPLTITGTQSNITLHLANLDPFNSQLQVNSVGNSTLQSPAVNAIFGRTPSDTADTQAVDGTLQATWGYADRFVHQLSPVGNGRTGSANYLSCYGLRTHYNVAPMLATETTNYQTVPPSASTRRQMLQTNANVQVWLVRPLNGTDPLESTDIIPIGYHSANFPGANADRLDNEIRVIIPHRLGFTDSTGATINDDVKVLYENRTGETNLEIRNAPATFNPTTIPTVLTDNELTITNSTTNGVWIMDAINVFVNRTTTALRQPLQNGNEVAGMNGDRTYILRSYRYDFPYQNNLGFGSVMTDAVTATQDIIPSTQDLQPFLNGRTPTSFPVAALTDWADFFPAIRIDFFDGTPDGAFPLTGAMNTITFPGDLTLTTQPDAHNYVGNDVTIRVADSTANVLTGDINHFILTGTADLAGTNIPDGITLDGGTWNNWTGNLNNVTFADGSNPTIQIDSDNITGWTTTGAATLVSATARTVDITQEQVNSGLIAGTNVTFNITVIPYTISFTHEADTNSNGGQLAVFHRPALTGSWSQVGNTRTATGANQVNVSIQSNATGTPGEYLVLWRPHSASYYTTVRRFDFTATLPPPNEATITVPKIVIPNVVLTSEANPATVTWQSADVSDDDDGNPGALHNEVIGTITGAHDVRLNGGQTQALLLEAYSDAAYLTTLTSNVDAIFGTDAFDTTVDIWDIIVPTSSASTSAQGRYVQLDTGDGTQQQLTALINSDADASSMTDFITADITGAETGTGQTIQFPAVQIFDNPQGISADQVRTALLTDLRTINTNAIIASVKPSAVQGAQGGNVQI